MPFTSTNRICQVKSPLGPDVLLLQRFDGVESISRPFRFQAEFVSEKGALDFQQIVGKGVTFTLSLANKKKRHFHGIVSRFSQGESAGRFVSYHAEIVPWTWLLTRGSDCRIYQDKTVQDIVKDVFSKLGFTDFRFEIAGALRQRKYCVQYRETHFNFVSRLLEEEGVSYWFDHQDGKHVMVITNSATGFSKCEGQPTAEYASTRAADQFAGEVEHLTYEREIHPGKMSVQDFNPETPRNSLLATRAGKEIGGNAKFEIFDYATEHQNKGDGDQVSKLRMEAEEASATRAHGSSSCAGFMAGTHFKLGKHYRDDYNLEFLLTEVRHAIVQGMGYDEGGSSYSNSFAAFPHSQTFRPLLLTPKPVIQGVQTATVVGKTGEELDVDKYGRIVVQFHWDREGKRDDKSSCRVRVAQDLAGKNFGSVFWPRIGQEVIVEFIEGDPDRPIVTGRVYNHEQMPPWTLPDNVTQSGIKTRSSKGGGASNFNELRFDDKKGQEHVFLHAEKDFHERVKAGSWTFVGGESHSTVKKDHFEQIDMNRHSTIKMDRYEDVQQSAHLTVGMEHHTKVGMVQAVEAGQEIHLKAGMNVVIEAGLQLTIKGAGGFISIGPDGVTIQGMLVKINSGGAAGSGSGAKPKKPKPTKEPKTT